MLVDPVNQMLRAARLDVHRARARAPTHEALVALQLRDDAARLDHLHVVLAVPRDEVVVVDDPLLAGLQLPRDHRAHPVHEQDAGTLGYTDKQAVAGDCGGWLVGWRGGGIGGRTQCFSETLRFGSHMDARRARDECVLAVVPRRAAVHLDLRDVAPRLGCHHDLSRPGEVRERKLQISGNSG